MYDNTSINNYVIDIHDKKYIVKRYQKFVVKGIYYIFLGIFDNERDVPNVTCMYVVNNVLKIKTVRRACIPKDSDSSNVTVPETRSTGDELPLKIDIHFEDDELMIIMKSILLKRGLTVGQFKDMYGEERKTDMNNDKSRLENKHTLSWNKFKFLLSLLGHEYDLFIYDNV